MRKSGAKDMTNLRTIDVKVSLTTSHEYQRHAPGQARGRREARHFGDKEVSFTDALRELTDGAFLVLTTDLHLATATQASAPICAPLRP